MVQSFGELLRSVRREHEKTLGDMARALGISVVYLSDIERGNRKPLSAIRCLEVASYLGISPSGLLAAAANEKGVLEYDLRKAPALEADVMQNLVSGLHRGGVSDDQLRKIRQILGEKESEEG